MSGLEESIASAREARLESTVGKAVVEQLREHKVAVAVVDAEGNARVLPPGTYTVTLGGS